MPIPDLVAFVNQQLLPQASGSRFVLDETTHQVQGRLGAWALSSVFQPLSDTNGQIRGYEALLRAHDGQQNICPDVFFTHPTITRDIVCWDRFCRYLHTLNFLAQQGTQDLYLNINAGHLRHIEHDHGVVFERTLRQFGLEPQQIVLEIVESAMPDSSRLHQALENYRARGYRIALDDFGSQHSNFDRLWLLTPDLVKLDRSLLLQAEINPRARTILPRLVDMLHDLGVKVVAEGIETAEQWALAQSAQVDLLQGFFLAHPATQLLNNARQPH